MVGAEDAAGLGGGRLVKDLGFVEPALVEADASPCSERGHVVGMLGAEHAADAMFILDRQ